jgi:hypothetical protein
MTHSNVFYLLPSTEKSAENPRELPREIIQDEDWIEENKKGRPSKRTKALKGKAALDQLDRWLQKTTPIGSEAGPSYHHLVENPPNSSLRQYQSHKEQLLAELERQEAGDKILSANKAVVERLKQAENIVEGDRPGIERVERAALEGGGGILRLLEGAGK